MILTTVFLFKGWGYNHNSCGQCDSCLSGDDIYCSDRQLYGRTDLHQGSFAAEAAWKKSFIYHIPDAIALMHAAPLMCGGATVFNVLYNYEIKTGDRVGIMGVGGLGHLGIQVCRFAPLISRRIRMRPCPVCE